MDKKKLPALAAGAALAALLGMNWDLFGQMNRLYGEIHALQEDFNHLREDYREAMDRQEAVLQEALEREASLFSQTETTLRYEDGALVLEAGVMPKEFRAGETALLSLVTGESVPLTDDGSGWLRGRLTCSLREEVAPVAALGTAESIQREALPSLRTEEALSMECKVQWEPLGAGGLDTVLQIELDPRGVQPNLLAEAVWVEVRYAILDPEDAGSLAGQVQAVQDVEGLWNADLGAYLVEGEDYHYNCYLTVHTEDGLELTSLGPAAERSWEGNLGQMTAGRCGLRPVF